MTSKLLLTLVVLGTTVSVLACASATGRSRDYSFGVTGVVIAEDGTPLQDAEVTLEVSGPVYVAVERVKTDRRVTNSTGGFASCTTATSAA